MSFQEVCDMIFKLYLYADSAKMVHYTIESMHGHELADQVRDNILDFVDELAEQYFGYYGKPRFGQLSLNHEINIDDDLSKICKNCVALVEPFRTECNKTDKLSGIVSLIDSFKEKVAKLVFLGTFDKVSNIKLS